MTARVNDDQRLALARHRLEPSTHDRLVQMWDMLNVPGNESVDMVALVLNAVKAKYPLIEWSRDKVRGVLVGAGKLAVADRRSSMDSNSDNTGPGAGAGAGSADVGDEDVPPQPAPKKSKRGRKKGRK